MEESVQQNNNNNNKSQLISWYFSDRFGQWVPYPDQVQMCVEDCYQKFGQNSQSSPIVECIMENRVYQINVKENTQKNKKTGTTRKITRIGDGNQIQIRDEQLQEQQQKEQNRERKLVWQFNGDKGWQNYDEQSQIQLTKNYNIFKQKPEEEVTTLQRQHFQYKINYRLMTQTNIQYKTTRQIRLMQQNPNNQEKEQA